MIAVCRPVVAVLLLSFAVTGCVSADGCRNIDSYGARMESAQIPDREVGWRSAGDPQGSVGEGLADAALSDGPSGYCPAKEEAESSDGRTLVGDPGDVRCTGHDDCGEGMFCYPLEVSGPGVCRRPKER